MNKEEALNENINSMLNVLDKRADVIQDDFGFNCMIDYWIKIKNACQKRINTYLILKEAKDIE